MRKCRDCKKEIPAIKVSDQWQRNGFCSVDCMADYGIKKARASIKKESRLSVRKMKGNDFRYQFSLTKRAAQKLANRIDEQAGHGCISCGTKKPTIQYCGGHFKTAGGHSEIALDIRNIMRQCNQYCNKNLSGNIEGTKTTKGYKAGVLDRYGQAYLDWLESYHEPLSLTCDDLIKLRAEYAAETRRVEAGEFPTKNWRSLD